MKIKLITKTLATFLLLISVFTSGLLYGDVEKDNIRAVQQVLKDCGFNPGPIDGIWGNKTTAAAKSFVRAHGGSPEAANYVILMVKVDAYRVGDAGPCPPPGTELASEESGPTEEAGSAETDQAEESKVVGGKSENELLADVRDYLDGRTSAETSSDGTTTVSQLKVLGNRIEYTVADDSPTSVWTFSLQDIEGVEENTWYDEYAGFWFRCKKDPCIRFLMEGEGEYWSRDIHIPIRSDMLTLFDTDLQGVKNAVETLNNLIAHYNEGGNANQSAGQPAKCYNWAKLGKFHLGTWKNSYGQVTGSLPAGLDTKIWDDDTLWKDYETIRNNHCVVGAESAMDSAISAMVLVGRQAADVEAERKRIKNFYQTSLDKCQAYFDSKHRKYEGKFCN